MRGLYVVGDLTGIPLLKMSAQTGSRAVETIRADPGFAAERSAAAASCWEIAIVGAGVSGMAAALAAEAAGLRYAIFEAKRPFQTIADFPKEKPIFAYPTEMTPDSKLQFHATVKEALLQEMRQQTGSIAVTPQRVAQVRRRAGRFELELGSGETIEALRVIVAIGRSGNFRKLDVPGEELEKVHNRLHDPRDYAGKKVLVVGGGDSALESAIALTQGGADVTLSYRKAQFSRPKPENLERIAALIDDPDAAVAVDEPSSDRVTTASGAWLTGKRGRMRLAMASTVREIDENSVLIESAGAAPERLENDVVFSMIGREAPLDFFRRAGVRIRGETRGFEWIGVIGFFLAIFLLYDWKQDGFLCQWLIGLRSESVFPNNVPALLSGIGDRIARAVGDRSTLVGTLAVSMKSRSFYYTLLYTLCVGIFGWRRIRRRNTPYVTAQTSTLFAIQLFPLFLLPELILPWLGYNGAFDAGWLGSMADTLFEKYIPDAQYLAADWPEWGHPRAYWRAYGLILAWPLSVYNVFTDQPQTTWLIISFVQTFVLIPAIVWRWGKGAYCGWICSCGGLAETLGDTLRDKMPHGPGWNRLNMLGQAILGLAFVLLTMRILGWLYPDGWIDRSFPFWFEGKDGAGMTVNPFSWKWGIDVIVAGVLGVGLYAKYSGRLWCRFACPLAALMHVYARFSRFRILSEKKKCISCDVCTSVCHQGIDVMNFANKGLPMADPQCVRCSACVQACPTGVLAFGRVDSRDRTMALDRLVASPVRAREGAQ